MDVTKDNLAKLRVACDKSVGHYRWMIAMYPESDDSREFQVELDELIKLILEIWGPETVDET